MKKLLVGVFSLLLVFNINFIFNKANSHELDYDPVMLCMNRVLQYNDYAAMAARLCRNASEFTKDCMTRVMQDEKNVAMAARLCTPTN